MDRHDVYTADECFLTGTAAEVIPVVECDGRAIGTGKPGPITRRAPRAVPCAWSAKSGKPRGSRRDRDPPILAPTDFSDARRAGRAVRLRAGRAARVPSCTCSTSCPRSCPAGPDPLLMPVMPPEYYKETEDRALATLDSLLDPAWGKPPLGHHGGALGKPGRRDRRYATTTIDLIVIATHGRTGLSHVLLGSVAERIVREAPCPVLTIRDKSRSRPAGS